MNERPREENRGNSATALLLVGALAVTAAGLAASKDASCASQAAFGWAERVTPDQVAQNPEAYKGKALDLRGKVDMLSRTVQDKEVRVGTSGLNGSGVPGGFPVTVHELRRRYVINGQEMDLVIEQVKQFEGSNSKERAYSEPEPYHDKFKAVGCLQEGEDGQPVLTAYRLETTD